MYSFVKEEKGSYFYQEEEGEVKIRITLDMEAFHAEIFVREEGACAKTGIYAHGLKPPFYYFLEAVNSVPEEDAERMERFYEEREPFLALVERWEKILLLLVTLDKCRGTNPEYLKEVCRLFYIDASDKRAEERCVKNLLAELSKYEEFKNAA